MFSILRSLFYNFKYLSFIQAIHLPIKVGKNTFICGDGDIILDIPISNLKRGIISIGLNYEKCINSKTDRTQVYIYGKLRFCGKANIGIGTRIVILPKGSLSIGSNFNITGRSSIRIYRSVEIGSDCLFSWDILIMDYDAHRIIQNGMRVNDHQPIKIGNKVWIGCRSSIWDGAEIPDNVVLGNNSVIRTKLPRSNCVYVGRGVIVREDITWER